MKRVGHLYETMCDIDFIKKAIRNAAKGKTDRAYTRRIIDDIDYYAQELKQNARSGRRAIIAVANLRNFR